MKTRKSIEKRLSQHIVPRTGAALRLLWALCLITSAGALHPFGIAGAASVDSVSSVVKGSSGSTEEEREARALDRELKENKGNPARTEGIERTFLLRHKDVFLAKLKAADPKTREQGVFGVSNLKLREAIPQLCEMALRDPVDYVRGESLGALGCVASPADKGVIVPVMLKSVDFKDSFVRFSVAMTLIKFRNREGIGVLVDLLSSENDDAQIQAFNVLELKTKRSFGTIEMFRDLKDPNLRWVFRNPAQKAEIFAKWRQWWKEEGDRFEFPEK